MPRDRRSLLARLRDVFLGRPHWRPASPLGRAGERAAVRFLRKNRYRVLGTNVRTPVGEADIVAIAPDRRTLVIAEAKSRSRTPGQPELSASTAPEAAVTFDKRRRLQTIARHLAAANNWLDRPVRIDVLAVEFEPDRPPTVRHLTGLPWV